MNKYELVVMYSPEFKDADVKALFEELASRTKDLGGKLTLAEDWGLKNLAYKINKFDQAYYHIYNLDLSPEKVTSVVTYLNHKDGVIRNLLTVLEKED